MIDDFHFASGYIIGPEAAGELLLRTVRRDILAEHGGKDPTEVEARVGNAHGGQENCTQV